jgi:FkbM family methyltransferase
MDVRFVKAAAGATNYLFRHTPRIYLTLYDTYKRVTERQEISLIRQLVRPGNRVVDVGANVGFYARILAESVGPNGHVYAFEPEETNFALLTERSRPYVQIHLARAAVTDRDGRVELHLSPDLNVDHRTYRSDEARRTVPVKAVRLDTFFDDRTPLDFIKMDIQGAEYAALLGMQAVVARSPGLRILTEFWPYGLDRFGQGTDRMLDLLQSWGFRIHLLKDGKIGEGLFPGAPIPGRDNPNIYFNILCARVSRPRHDHGWRHE